LRTAAVRYASVRIWLRPRTGAEIATDGGGGNGYADRPPGLVPLTWRLGCLLDVVISPVAGFGLGLGVLGAEGVGDPPVRGASLPVDAVRVDLQQTATPCAARRATSVAGTAEFSHSDTAA
jgi:hypothetical protein